MLTYMKHQMAVAIGGSLEEAIFHGILEVVERDAFFAHLVC